MLVTGLLVPFYLDLPEAILPVLSILGYGAIILGSFGGPGNGKGS